MKFLVIFVMTILLAMSVFAAPTSEGEVKAKPRKCVPGKSYFDGCNNCSCGSVPSEHPFCTLKACYDPVTNKYLQPQEPPEDFWLKN